MLVALLYVAKYVGLPLLLLLLFFCSSGPSRALKSFVGTILGVELLLVLGLAGGAGMLLWKVAHRAPR